MKTRKLTWQKAKWLKLVCKDRNQLFQPLLTIMLICYDSENRSRNSCVNIACKVCSVKAVGLNKTLSFHFWWATILTVSLRWADKRWNSGRKRLRNVCSDLKNQLGKRWKHCELGHSVLFWVNDKTKKFPITPYCNRMNGNTRLSQHWIREMLW